MPSQPVSAPLPPAVDLVSPVAAVLVHVGDVAAGLAWYGRAFPQAVRVRPAGFDSELLSMGTVGIEIVPADAKCSSGSAGSIVYWRVQQLDDAIRHMASLGAALYRGPMAIEDGLGMCQVRDPWGNCIGLRGPMAAQAALPQG